MRISAKKLGYNFIVNLSVVVYANTDSRNHKLFTSSRFGVQLHRRYLMVLAFIIAYYINNIIPNNIIITDDKKKIEIVFLYGYKINLYDIWWVL